jgi:tetratricopeptide (TPR) repeat protein
LATILKESEVVMTHKSCKNTVVLSLLVCILLSASTRVWATSAECIDLNNEATQALVAGKYEIAIEKYKDALKRDPGYELARKNLGMAYKVRKAHAQRRQIV